MTAREIKKSILKDWPSRLILTAIVTFCGWAYVRGNDAIDARIITVMQPKMDSTNAKLDQVIGQMNALIDVMRETFPAFKQKALERAQDNKDSKDVKDALKGNK